MDALTGWMKDPNRTQQMQSLGGFIEDTGIPKTVQRMAYGEPITNINQANVPLLKPETGNAALAVLGALPVGAPAAKMLPKNIPVGMSIKPVGGGIQQAISKTAVPSSAGFYSAAEQAALNLQRNKGSGQAFINDLMKAPDVKKDELQYTGLLDAFANRPQATKQEVIDHLQKNRVKVGANLKRNPEDMTYEDLQDEHIRQTGFDIGDNWDSQDILNSLHTDIGTLHDSYQLPRGERYRELLLDFPSNKDAEKALNRFNNEMAQKYYSEGAMWPRVGTYEEVAKLNELKQAYKTQTPEYYGGHWDEPNVFAHVRMNDRIDADGKKMAYIEEVQSDWHQAGRTRGYNKAENEILQAKATSNYKTLAADAYQQITDAHPELIGRPVSEVLNLARLGPYGDKQNAIDLRTRQLLEPVIAKVDEAKRKAAEVKLGPVPDAPMKDTWYQTALRKAVKDAIDQGSDRVGISTAKLQERFITDGNVEGMRKYYDEVYPKYLDKFAKKYGSKVMQTEIPVGEKQLYPDINNFTKWYLKTKPDASMDEIRDTWSKGTGSKMFMDFIRQNVDKETVNYIEITPEMRKALRGSKGVPLFQMAPAIPAGMTADGLLGNIKED